MVKDKAIAEDIVQHVWIKVWEKRHGLNHELSFKSYLYTAVRNQALKYIRDTKDKFASLESIDSLADGTILQDDQMHDKETLKLINEAIDQLPGKCREIFMLNRYEGLSYKEITEVLNISINTVKTQMTRALSSLRKALKITISLFNL
jgi:RNA polymerase sigma-70 factor (ECF subfamily)